MNIKKAAAAILSAVLAFSSAGFPENPGSVLLSESQTVNAADIIDSGWCGDDVQWKMDSDYTLTIFGQGAMSTKHNDIEQYNDWSEAVSVVIESGVTSITGFENCQKITSVKIPDTVTTIGSAAFSKCSGLTSIDMPESVSHIGLASFYYCTNLKSITIPESVTTIYENTFALCPNLETITIPYSVTEIRGDAFAGCTNLKAVTILNPKCSIPNSGDTFCNKFSANTSLYSGEIRGYTGSTAQAYAKKYKRTFVAIDNDIPLPAASVSPVPTAQPSPSPTPASVSPSPTPITDVSKAPYDESSLSKDKINIILDQKVTGKPGETVRVNASFIDYNSTNIDTLQVRFDYDPRLKAKILSDSNRYFNYKEADFQCAINASFATETKLSWINENFPYFLFTIPDDAEPGTVYDLKWTDLSTYQFNMINTHIDNNNFECKFINGSIVVAAPEVPSPEKEPSPSPKASPTPEPASPVPSLQPSPSPEEEPSPLPTTVVTPSEPVIQSILNTDPKKVKSPVLDWNDRTVLNQGDSIEVQIDTQMALTGDRQIEFDVMLSDFSPTYEYFDYAGLVFDLPDGVSVAEIKTYLNGIVKEYSSDSAEAKDFRTATGVNTESSVFEFTGIDISDQKKDIVLCSLVLNIPENPAVVNKVSVKSVFGRLTEKTEFYDDGSVLPYVSVIDNGNNGIAYSETEFSILTGIKGDVDLNENVSQVDATYILRELLSESVDNKSILDEMIKDNVNGELADEDYVSLSRYLGDVSPSPQKRFSQTDATFILRALLEADISGQTEITPEIWDSVLG